jgi:3-dehydroquinate synthase
MEPSVVSEPLVIHSHRGTYQVSFDEDALDRLGQSPPKNWHFIIDAKVAKLYSNALSRLLASPSVLQLEATESNKAIDKIEGYVEHLLQRRVRRSDVLIALGGGIVQDVVCFLATTVLRGLEWHHYPTTLLAQADSCIGSKSSINVGNKKNLMGTFYPPSNIFITTQVLETLDEKDIHSGIGEMLKVHAICGPEAFDQIAKDYPRLLNDRDVLVRYIRQSLEIKKPYVELDEFDRGPRNVMNYGHSFGHAIESATDFAIPHGIAVTLGMDMANYVSMQLGRMGRPHFDRMHGTLAANYVGFENVDIPFDAFLTALGQDKKNLSDSLRLVLPDRDAKVSLGTYANDDTFRRACGEFLSSQRKG